MTRLGASTEDQVERLALHALSGMVEGAEVAIMLGDPFRVGLSILAALEPWDEAVRAGQRMTIEEFRDAADQPPFQGRWDLAMQALFDGLIAVARVKSGDDEEIDACHILAWMLGGP